MENDFFKKYIQEHKDAFENEALPPNMLGNILGNLKEREELKKLQKDKKRKLTYTWLAVACSLLMILGSYLFVAQEDMVVTQPLTQVSSLPSKVEQPSEHMTEKASTTKQKTIETVAKHFASHRPNIDQNQAIYDGLADSLSVATRLDAIIKAGTLASLTDKLKATLCHTFDKDGNDNVRLATLEVLSKFSNDKYIQEQLMAGLSKEKDPVVQLELIKIMGNNSSPETTNKLIAMANNPSTVEAVKEQVYYALLTNDK